MATHPKKPFVSEAFVRRLSEAQRQMLVDHLDRAVPIDVGDGRSGVRQSLVGIGLLRDASPGPASPRPAALRLTEDGRMALAILLAWYADALARVGWDGQPETPLQILRRLKAAGRPAVPAPEPWRAGVHNSVDS